MKLQMILNQKGDLITNIAEAHTISKALKAIVYLNLECHTSMAISPESYQQDLITIALSEQAKWDMKVRLDKFENPLK